jgi:predicted alpha/beta hydrolase family esterase
LPFPSLVIASTDDSYCEIGAARSLAGQWGAGFIDIGAVGHINPTSGFGNWPEGIRLLEAFRAGTTR